MFKFLPVTRGCVGIRLLRYKAVAFSIALLALLAPPGKAADALSYTKNYFVTGDYSVTGVGLRGTGVNGFATGTINVTDVPAGADIVAAFLYWQTVETTPAPSAANGFFDGKAIVGALRGSATNPACWSSGGTTGPAGSSGRVYRADVLRYLQVDNVNSVRIANGPHVVKLPDSGAAGNGNPPYTNGASLVVVYRLLASSAVLRSVVIYDGAYTLAKHLPPMTQLVGGFYQAADIPNARMTQIASNGQPGFETDVTVDGEDVGPGSFTGKLGQRWDNPTFSIHLEEHPGSFRTAVSASDNQTCLTFSAIVASTAVMDSDNDGLLDLWETSGMHLNPGDATTPATFGTCQQFPNDIAYPCVNLPAMGANPAKKDIFVEIDWEQGLDGHVHAPKLDALNMVGAAFAAQGIQLHFDVGGIYAASGSAYVVPAKYARGGDVISEGLLLCPNAKTNVCTYPGTGYAVQSWKIGYKAVKDGFPALGIPAHFDHARKDIFHYSLFAHALAAPSSTPGVPASVSGVADRPGGDLMITLGLWRSDIAGDDQTGSILVQAGTLMHELGHNLGLSHAGLYRVPNCEPNYPSVMNYLYQTRGLTDAAGNSHIDYSYGSLPDLNEGSLSETGFLSTLYRVRFYGPPGPNNLGIAKAHCDGTPLAGELGVRLEAPIGTTIDWNNNGAIDSGTFALDVDFNGYTGDPAKDSVTPAIAAGAPGKRWLVDSNDWANLNLRQISARLNVGGLSADVGQTDLGQTDLGQTDLGQTDLGQTDLGQTDLGQTDLGQTDLGQTDLGDVDYATVIATLDPTSPAQPLTAASSLTGITLNWGAPSIGQIRQYLIYRSDPVNTTPALIGTVNVAPPVPAVNTYTDTVNSTTTLYNVNYTYFVASVDINGTISSPSNNAGGIVDHLFIAANNVSQKYGSAIPASFTFATTGINPPGLAGTTTCTITAVQTSNVGGYAITCSGLTPALGVTFTPGTLAITPAPLAINAVTFAKVYDATTTASAIPTYSGLLFAGQTVTGLAEAFDSPNAGARTLAVSAGYTVNDGNGGLNYTVTASTAAGTITPAPASVTPNAGTKVYGTADPAFSGTLAGFVASDGVTATYTRTAGANVGSYSISATLSAAVAGALANYNITYNTANFTITPAPASVTPNAGTKVYGTADPAFSGTLTGFVASDGVTAAYTRTAGENVGSYPIAATLSATVAGALSNYNITYNTANFTITQATASVTPNAGTKVYGAADPILTGTLTGFVPSDGVTAAYTRAPGANVGAYTISATLSAAVAGALSNYNITYNTANFAITQATASVTPNAGTKVYGTADPAFSGTLTGFVATDGVTAAYTRAPGANVGAYPISATLSAAVAGALANYTITYNTASFTITPASASVTPNAGGKVYGTADPAFSGTLTGFVATDGVTAAYTRAAGENVGVYPISATLSAAPAGALANYNITYNTANFTIAPAPQSITFGPLSNLSIDDENRTVSLSATATSGLTVTFTAAGSCSVTGSTVSVTGEGACTITAQQPGSLNYQPAPSVSQTFTITND